MTVVRLVRKPAGWLARAHATARRSPWPMTTSATLVITVTGLLLGGGLLMILSTSWVTAFQRYGSSFVIFAHQLEWAVAGVVAMLVVSRIDYRHFRRLGYGLYIASVAGLAVVVLHPSMGMSAGGSTRWLAVGPARFQPSELAKLALVLVAADLCVRKGSRLRTVKDAMVPLGVMAGLVGGLVMLQPDLGTTVILGSIVFVVLFLAGTPLGTLGMMGSVGMGVAAALSLSEGYRRERLFGFLNPFADRLDTGYQAVQARIALGSGGLFGVGLGASRQKWMYVPNAHTDFILAIIGEEVGLIGTLAVVGLFVLLGYAGVRTARRAPDTFGRIVAGGITAWILGQGIVNMGAVTGLLPITGVPLPLVSFGGSSLMFTMVALGILVNIARQEQWPPKVIEEAAGRVSRRQGGARASR
ncbi:MAG: putative lipid II flippase FtsW [Actinomycetota bacterium]